MQIGLIRQAFGRRIWWALTGSNRRHSACKADALPTELSALRNKTTLLFYDARQTECVVLVWNILSLRNLKHVTATLR